MTESKRPKVYKSRKLRVIPLGGLHEIGKNMTVLEYGNDIMIIDCGMAFPDDEMLGIDVVIPDFSYLVANSDKIRGLVITHAHEDHIGAIPYLLQKLNVPIYSTRLTLGFIKNKLKEHKVEADLHEISPGDEIRLGVFRVEAIHTTHSVADSLALCIDTPVGKVFHTGDFKIDYTPVDGEPLDLNRLAALGDEGVLLLMADSTNAARKGYTPSEKQVGIALNNIFASTKKRIIIAIFASNVHRAQRIIDMAVANGRKVAISGRSMENMVRIAEELGYLDIPDGTLVEMNKIKNIPDDKLVIMTTGSQGEPMSALARMANSMHRQVQIRPGDMVILSSTAVPGNEKMVSNVVNSLMEKGAEVIYNDIAETHVSGHASSEELKLIHTLLRPSFFMPVHGEMKHLMAHAQIAESLGLDKSRILLGANGDVFELTRGKAKKAKETVHAGAVMVDGLGIGDVGSSVLKERSYLSEAGLIVMAACFENGRLVSGPQLE
ncbi:MAG: ribonuclease J, partial [Firmicutes bacterium]|nr:ribonuclease J [Bacillota bacterium]